MSDSARLVGQASSSNFRAADRVQHALALPFYLVEPVVIAVDLVLLVSVSAISGIGYHWLFLNRVPNFSPYIGIGAGLPQTIRRRASV